MKYIQIVFMLLLAIGSPFVVQAFPDVPMNHAHYDAINYLKDQGIVAGNPDGTYKPDDSISRAAFTKIIVETYFDKSELSSCDLGAMPFSDVPAEAWFASYVCVAESKSLIKGYPDGTFRPGNNINVAEAAKIISAHRNGVQEGSPWYRPYVEDLATAGAFPEDVNAIEQLVDRGIMAEMIYRLKSGITNKSARAVEYFFPSEVTETQGEIPDEVDDFDSDLDSLFEDEASIEDEIDALFDLDF